ncbi:hypothetical protein BCR42DRAFT_450445 [Absidia repens]|uniref:Monopolin complex subunit Csm1/Pcs1 C-terminal domain-containing protein n=1 Tax=Absidia repens TaxID=90262 RepID=A0A1X2IK62_9FUNG|nr:hypothetical protein BCR42DRAFT_450445 [Absidia repens]
MSNKLLKKRRYEAVADSTAPTQDDIEMKRKMSSQDQQHQVREVIYLDDDNDEDMPAEQMNPTTPGEIDFLKEELKQLNLRAVQLENRAISAESGYMELKQLKETQVKEHLKEYKLLADRRFKASEVEIQTLKELTEDQAQHLAKMKSRMEMARAELVEFQSGGSSRKAQHEKTVSQYNKYKDRYNATNKKVNFLRAELQSLLKEDELLLRQNSQDVDALPRLRHTLKLYTELAGLEIKDHESNEVWDAYTCSQTGRNGRISYRLTLIKNDKDENQRMARYVPIISESDADILPPYLKEELEFVQSDCSIFFLRITTVMNKT